METTVKTCLSAVLHRTNECQNADTTPWRQRDPSCDSLRLPNRQGPCNSSPRRIEGPKFRREVLLDPLQSDDAQATGFQAPVRQIVEPSSQLKVAGHCRRLVQHVRSIAKYCQPHQLHIERIQARRVKLSRRSPRRRIDPRVHSGHTQQICNTPSCPSKSRPSTPAHVHRAHHMDNFYATLHAQRCPDNLQPSPLKTTQPLQKHLHVTESIRTDRSAHLAFAPAEFLRAHSTDQTNVAPMRGAPQACEQHRDQSSQLEFACCRP